MAALKTVATKQSVAEFLNQVEDEQKRADCQEVLAMMQQITGEEPVLWGSGMIGFGSYHYKSQRSTQEGDWPLTGFSPRKQNLTIYIMSGFDDKQALLATLGKHKASRGCLYIKRLADIDTKVLAKIITLSIEQMRQQYPAS